MNEVLYKDVMNTLEFVGKRARSVILCMPCVPIFWEDHQY